MSMTMTQKILAAHATGRARSPSAPSLRAGELIMAKPCKHPPAASLFSPAFRALGSKPGTKVLPGAH